MSAREWTSADGLSEEIALLNAVTGPLLDRSVGGPHIDETGALRRETSERLFASGRALRAALARISLPPTPVGHPRMEHAVATLPSHKQAMAYARDLARARVAIYRPRVQVRPSGEWNVWWWQAS